MMSPTLLRAFAIGAAVAVLLALSAVRLVHARTASATLQFLGAVLLLVVVLAHLAEALQLFPSMGWGQPHSVGHYIDLVSAVSGTILLAAAAAAQRGFRQP